MKEQKICPFCGSEKGYYVTERVIRDLFLITIMSHVEPLRMLQNFVVKGEGA